MCVCLGLQAVCRVSSGSQAAWIGVLNRDPWEIRFVNIWVKGLQADAQAWAVCGVVKAG